MDDPQKFAFCLNFYAKEEGGKKKVLRFDCEEEKIDMQQFDYMDEEEKKKFLQS